MLFLVRITGTEPSPHHMVGGGARHRPPTPGAAPTDRMEGIARVHREGEEDRPAGDDEEAPVAAVGVSGEDGAAVAEVDLDVESSEDRNSTALVETFIAEVAIGPVANSTQIKFVVDDGNAAEVQEKKVPVPADVEHISAGVARERNR